MMPQDFQIKLFVSCDPYGQAFVTAKIPTGGTGGGVGGGGKGGAGMGNGKYSGGGKGAGGGHLCMAESISSMSDFVARIEP